MTVIPYHTGFGAEIETIDFAGDYDIYQVELTGGFDYAAAVLGQQSRGGTLQDPYIEIYSSRNGQLLYQVDDSTISGVDSTLLSMIDLPNSGLGVTSYDPSFTFEAPYSGDYYIVVGGVGRSTGSYTFNIDQALPPTSLTGF